MTDVPNTMECPYCSVAIQLVAVNCGILRCGLYQLKNGKIRQLPKHGSKEKIDRIKEKYGILYGCGNPIKYENKTLVKTHWVT
jgi:hypothetical protein